MKRLRRTIGNDFLNFKRKIGRMFINNTILYIHIYPRLRVRPARRVPTKASAPRSTAVRTGLGCDAAACTESREA